MIRLVNILIISASVQSFVFGQAGVSYAKNETTHQNVPTEPTTKVNLNTVPFFGSRLQKQSDLNTHQKLINTCLKNFKSKEEASNFFAERGWEYIAESEPDTAIYRFNLAHLLNPKNAETYWGLGVACFHKADYELAADILEQGIELDNTNSSMIVDLALVELACYENKNHEQHLIKAHNHLGKAIELDPSNTMAWLKRAEAEYHLKNYDNAWECIHSARLLDSDKVDLLFIEKLASKMEDPEKIFRF